MPDQTPMMKQYLAIKEKHQDAILFFRLGDFYEMFFDDAEVASKALDLVLTGRGKDENRMPMCGIPYHASQNYIARLIDQGFKVAICEQVEDPKDAKGVVKREVVRIITPGTVIESNLLKEKTNNYLLAITKEKNKYGLAYIDASTGEFKLTELENKDKLLDEINRVNPAELLISDMLTEEVTSYGLRVTSSEFQDTYDTEAAEEKLKSFFKVKSLDSFGLENAKAAWGAAVAILEYLKETQKSSLDHINSIQAYQTSDFMFIDAATRRNLELVQTIRDKYYQGSLLWVLDKTKTSMGGRLLRQWLLQPLLNADKINNRLEAVDELFNNTMLRAELATEIKAISDIERIVGRIAAESANARDLMALKESLRLIPKLKGVMCNVESVMLKKVKDLSDFEEIVTLLTCSIVEDPPFILKDGGLIKDGYNQELDEIKSAAREGKDWIAHLETEERKRTGIKSIKVGFTRVFGYYIEVTNSNLAQIPDNYIRKQTLTNCERYITPELKEKESLILNADERLKKMEYEVFCQVRVKVAESTAELQKLAHVLAQTDVLLGLAEVAVENDYCKPEVQRSKSKDQNKSQDQNPKIKITESRHPVVEKTLGEHRFVPNDVEMEDQASRFLLITGPNMAGKSTYMRQIALISLMAQIGSFVPAKSAELCLVDRIFTRIGAMDDIFSGQSTFMMEMTETANILHNATDKSLIILDEIGRGTATFDGMSIAAAVAEYIHTKIKAKTLFATHYHEITQLADKHPGMKNLNVLIKESGDQITFLHKIVEGPADKSYGIQVGKLAGLPKEVIERAKQVYDKLEMVENDLGQSDVRSLKSEVAKRKKTITLPGQEQVSLF
ncbi:DNA mismatch repair protein MutS [candidate division WOR-1 bacterium RIFOXYB2_FULL_42_35]|nr:MAG: DNA mismatch repair protein MutS [candidate division WOR-1 bacterium RIFOXYA2_FULL_41_14]OGC22187.1 MAG: DNA mismatch repair protein MutS [candidate division WOR-1 bacterium RIFOXYB2_FULL_42_35]